MAKKLSNNGATMPSKHKKKELQTRWLEKIRRAKKVRENWAGLMQVDKARNFFDGRQNPGKPEAEWITVNKIYSFLKAQYPALYSVDPYFYVKLARCYKPVREAVQMYEQMGKIRGGMLNYLKKEQRLKQKARLCVHDAHFEFGVMKTHFAADTEDNPNAGQAMLSEDTGLPLMENDEFVTEPDELVTAEKYCWTRIHPQDFLWGEDSGPLEEEWDWVAQRIRTTIEKAKKDKRFDKAALKNLEGKGETKDQAQKAREERKKGSGVVGDVDAGHKKAPKNDDDPFIYWEIYDFGSEKWLWVAEEGEVPLKMPEDLPPGVEKHPFSVLIFTPRDDSPYPVTPVSQMLPLQQEYNQARSDIQKHRKRFNRKYLASRQAFADETGELTKITTGEDGIIVLVDGMDVNAALAPVKDAPLDQMRYQELGFLANELIEVGGGTSDEARGIAGSESATQASILDKRLQLKEGDALSMVIDFVKDCAKKMDQLVQAHLDTPTAVKVTGPQGEFWETVTPASYEDIEGEYEYDVNVGSTMPQLPHVERASWMAFLGLMFQNPAFLLSKRLFKKMSELHGIEDEAMVEELHGIAMQMVSGQLPAGGQQGSQPGVPEDRPVSAQGGMLGGNQSLNLPGAGNIE
jgi:hypothetical protein